MLFCSLQHIVVRSRLVFVIVWFTIILPHWVIFELITHQDATHIVMALKPNTVKIENFALLKFCTAPDWCERRQPRSGCAISSTHSNNYRSMFLRDRIQVINRFEIAWDFLLLGFLHFRFRSLYNLFHLHLFCHDAVEPIDTSCVGAEIETQCQIVAQKFRNLARML